MPTGSLATHTQLAFQEHTKGSVQETRPRETGEKHSLRICLTFRWTLGRSFPALSVSSDTPTA